MMNMILVYSTITFSLFILYIGFLYFKTLLKIKDITKINSNLFIENMALKEAALIKNLEESDIHQENFIKFLSDSRNWAFEYIDQSQKQIKDFINIADKQFAYFDSYGMLSEGYLFYDTMKIISEEYKKLKTLLPEESDDRR